MVLLVYVFYVKEFILFRSKLDYRNNTPNKAAFRTLNGIVCHYLPANSIFHLRRVYS